MEAYRDSSMTVWGMTKGKGRGHDINKIELVGCQQGGRGNTRTREEMGVVIISIIIITLRAGLRCAQGGWGG